MKIERFEDIECWQLARALSRLIYSETKAGPFSKDYGLKDQIQRAACSIMHNIAEGFDAGSDAEFAKFLRYAQRSASEVKSQLYVALDQNYINEEKFHQIYQQVHIIHSKVGAFISYLTKIKK